MGVAMVLPGIACECNSCTLKSNSIMEHSAGIDHAAIGAKNLHRRTHVFDIINMKNDSEHW